MCTTNKKKMNSFFPNLCRLISEVDSIKGQLNNMLGTSNRYDCCDDRSYRADRADRRACWTSRSERVGNHESKEAPTESSIELDVAHIHSLLKELISKVAKLHEDVACNKTCAHVTTEDTSSEC
jgi:hypothetical protein